MLTKDGPGRYRHADDDTYRIAVEVDGTARRIVAVLGDRPLRFPATVDQAIYGSFGRRYEINALFTFTQDSTTGAKYTVTLLDANDVVVDARVVRLPAGSTLPRTIVRLFEFQVS